MKTVSAILIVIVLALGVGGIWWYVNDKNATKQSSANSTTEQQATEQNPKTDAATTITYTDTGFKVSNETVPVGSTILVVNESHETLQFSSDPHPQHTDNSELNLPTLRPGEQETMVIDKVGKWGFHNHLHDEHSGFITVTN